MRSLNSLHNDHQHFMIEQKGLKSQVSKYINCLHSPLLPIDLEFVCPPYLHITLGIVLKHHKQLEAAAHQLDKQLVVQCDDWATENGKKLKKFGANWEKAKKLEAQIDLLKQYVMCSTDSESEKYSNDLEKAEESLNDMSFAAFTDEFTGLIFSALDSVLTSHRITPHKYHSRSFTGNHCHKYITSEVYKIITQEIVTQVQQLT